ncbi:hypothetical protein DSM104443_02763 [Usitatibacter rugosus]|uniref:Uncharacterized protein n=1 Tax=Usitatibacter rugosus TaxID=2732067 RepID=A0A6M4GWK9_9PROT|nr:hypothetical protein [Usitatibacter rugosus]QJR11681.1 hypothetical protein DSM104443_02763 [Usitatibacter rugosus]
MTKDRRPASEVLAHTLAGRVRQRRGMVRFHMFLIVVTSVAMATLVTAGLLAVGVDALWKRYLPALLVAYGTFFLGVWVWLHVTSVGADLGIEATGARRARKSKSSDPGLDAAPDIGDIPLSLPTRVDGPVFHGGGGTFDGGGASSSWGDGVVDGVGDAVGSAFDDEGGFLLVIAIALVVLALALLFGAAGYVIYQAPAILSEVVFELLLAQPLARGMGAIESSRWFGALFSRTIGPFLLVAGGMLLFAAFAASVAPQARTAGEVLRSL